MESIRGGEGFRSLGRLLLETINVVLMELRFTSTRGVVRRASLAPSFSGSLSHHGISASNVYSTMRPAAICDRQLTQRP